jgi:hypothetical protein
MSKKHWSDDEREEPDFNYDGKDKKNKNEEDEENEEEQFEKFLENL